MSGVTVVRPRVCFLGAGRFTAPLEPTQAKKFALLRQLADIDVVAFAAPGSPRRFEEHARFHLLPMPSNRLLRYATFVVGGTVRLLGFGRRIDVVVAQSPYEAFGAVLAKMILRLGGHRLRCVIESHGDFEIALLDYRRVRFTGLYRRIMGMVARFTLQQADAVRAVSASTAAQLARVGVRGKVHVFHTWTDLDAFLALDSSVKEPGLLVYAGTLVPAKGVHVLLGALAEVVSRGLRPRLMLVGRAENPSYAAELREQVRRLGLSAYVEFCPHVPQRELATRVARAQALVLASLSSEGLPRVLLEAMAAGTGVVTTAIAGAVEVVRDGESGFLVAPNDAGALAARLTMLLSSPELARTMGERGRALVAGRFGSEVYRRGYARLFADALGDPAPPTMGVRPAVGAP